MNTTLTELEQESVMKYFELCNYLKNKYGKISGNYFVNEKCITPNGKIKRTTDGLFIHHIKENEYANLSQKENALMAPFEFQKGEYLVYCNYIEHLLLHLAIVREFLNEETIKRNNQLVGIGGLVKYIIPEIIDYLNGYEYSKEYMNNALSIIDGNELFVIKLIKDFTLKEYYSQFEFGTLEITKEGFYHLVRPYDPNIPLELLSGKMFPIITDKIKKLILQSDLKYYKNDFITTKEILEKIKKIYSENAVKISVNMYSFNEMYFYYIEKNNKGKSTNTFKTELTTSELEKLCSPYFKKIKFNELSTLLTTNKIYLKINENLKSKSKKGRKYFITVNEHNIFDSYYTLEEVKKKYILFKDYLINNNFEIVCE